MWQTLEFAKPELLTLHIGYPLMYSYLRLLGYSALFSNLAGVMQLSF